MNKHTPGPWLVDPSPYRSAGGGLCVMRGDECVALVGDFNPEQPIRENASLIAAAPELLSALDNLVDVADRYMDFDESSRFGVAIAKARAAIAKATA